MVSFDIVISAANSNYMAWQTQVVCYSALTRLGIAPIVVVHKTSSELLPEFLALAEYGCRIVEAESYARPEDGPVGLPRNLAGTLQALSRGADESIFKCDHILLCEPDMLFVAPLEYNSGLAAEFYDYVQYSSQRVLDAMQRFGIGDREVELNATSRVGVPYLIPRRVCDRLATRWLNVFDAFDRSCDDGSRLWIDIMPAFGIAAALERLPISVSRQINTNRHQDAQVTGQLIHYCYGDDIWSKRRYGRDRSPFADSYVADLAVRPGSILAEIRLQILGAAALYQRK